MPVSVPSHNAPRPPVPAPGGDQEWRVGVAAIQAQLADDPTVQDDVNHLSALLDDAYVSAAAAAYPLADDTPQGRAMARAAVVTLLRTAQDQQLQQSNAAAEAADATPEPDPEQPPAEG